MKIVKILVVAAAAVGMSVLVGCTGSTDDTSSTEAAISETDATGCYSVRDDKTYTVGTKVSGKHDALRCPVEWKHPCLAPDTEYTSECLPDGKWEIGQDISRIGL